MVNKQDNVFVILLTVRMPNGDINEFGLSASTNQSEIPSPLEINHILNSKLISGIESIRKLGFTLVGYTIEVLPYAVYLKSYSQKIQESKTMIDTLNKNNVN